MLDSLLKEFVSDIDTNMSYIAKNGIFTMMRKLYDKRDTDGLADFVFKSNDGQETRVHSLLLLSR